MIMNDLSAATTPNMRCPIPIAALAAASNPTSTGTTRGTRASRIAGTPIGLKTGSATVHRATMSCARTVTRATASSTIAAITIAPMATTMDMTPIEATTVMTSADGEATMTAHASSADAVTSETGATGSASINAIPTTPTRTAGAVAARNRPSETLLQKERFP